RTLQCLASPAVRLARRRQAARPIRRTAAARLPRRRADRSPPARRRDPPQSLAADYLVPRGENRGDLNVFASRRGNWEVMPRGTFHNRNLVNLLAPDAPVAHTIHMPTMETLPIREVAERYRAAAQP